MTDQSSCRRLAVHGEPCTVFFDKDARSFYIGPVFYKQEFMDRPGRYDHIMDLDWLPSARPAVPAGPAGHADQVVQAGPAQAIAQEGDDERDERADEEQMDLDDQAQTTTDSPQGNDKIPRPPNAWILFRKEKSKQLHEANPSMSVGQVSAEASRQWHALSDEDRAFYKQMAEEAKQQHKIQYPEYRYKPGRK